jgi:hypothetical protein
LTGAAESRLLANANLFEVAISLFENSGGDISSIKLKN